MNICRTSTLSTYLYTFRPDLESGQRTVLGGRWLSSFTVPSVRQVHDMRNAISACPVFDHVSWLWADEKPQGNHQVYHDRSGMNRPGDSRNLSASQRLCCRFGFKWQPWGLRLTLGS